MNAKKTSKSRKAPAEPAKQVRSGALLGDAPPMTPDANGWWWLWNWAAWCPARVRFTSTWRNEPELHVQWFRDGGVADTYLSAIGVRQERWGGRIAVPGASPNDQAER